MLISLAPDSLERAYTSPMGWRERRSHTEETGGGNKVLSFLKYIYFFIYGNILYDPNFNFSLSSSNKRIKQKFRLGENLGWNQ